MRKRDNTTNDFEKLKNARIYGTTGSEQINEIEREKARKEQRDQAKYASYRLDEEENDDFVVPEKSLRKGKSNNGRFYSDQRGHHGLQEDRRGLRGVDYGQDEYENAGNFVNENRSFRKLQRVGEGAELPSERRGLLQGDQDHNGAGLDLMEDMLRNFDEVDEDKLAEEFQELERQDNRRLELQQQARGQFGASRGSSGRMQEEVVDTQYGYSQGAGAVSGGSGRPKAAFETTHKTEKLDMDEFDDLDDFATQVLETQKKESQEQRLRVGRSQTAAKNTYQAPKGSVSASRLHNIKRPKNQKNDFESHMYTSQMSRGSKLSQYKLREKYLGRTDSQLVLTNQANSRASQALRRIRKDEIYTAQVPDEDGDLREVLPFYWIDMQESKTKRSTLTLYGKIQLKSRPQGASDAFVSAALTVKTNYRYTYFCKKLNSDFDDFEREVKRIVSRKFQAFSKFDVEYTRVKKKYAFELDVEVGENLEIDCLEVKYPFKYASLMETPYLGVHYKGIIGFSHTMRELVQIRKKLMGPGWLAIQDFEVPESGQRESWCRAELEIKDLEDLSRLPKAHSPEVPEITVCYLAVSQAKADLDSERVIDSIAMIEAHMSSDSTKNLNQLKPHLLTINPFQGSNSAQFSAFIDKMRSLFGSGYDSGVSEMAILKLFLEKILAIDPDLIIGHEVNASIEAIYDRLRFNKVENISRLSKFRRDNRSLLRAQQLDKWRFLRTVTTGRLVCDTYEAAREYMKEVDFSLEFLGKKHFKIDFSKIGKDSKSRGQENPLEYHCKATANLFKEAYLSYSISEKLQVIQLTKQLTAVAGCLWSQSLANKRAQRNEMLLMHQFHQRNFLLPDRIRLKKDAPNELRKKAEKYKGGLVIEPNPGLHHHYTLLLDFNSLYPSIIRQYKLCFTTVNRRRVPLEFYTSEKARLTIEQESKDPKELTMEHSPDAITPTEDTCLLPKIVGSLIKRRKDTKKKMKQAADKSEKEALNIRQLALKLIANSIYGCLGFGSSRFYSRDIASMVTYYGRMLLKSSAQRVNELGYEVIYGDTDSVMINSRTLDLIEAIKVARELKNEINKLFANGKRKRILEIEIDGLFKSLLLHKKKKYAANLVDNYEEIARNLVRFGSGEIKESIKLEIKGLDFIRRDWCELTKKTGKHLLGLMLSSKDTDEIIELVYDYMEGLGRQMKENKVALNDYIIYKMLKKDPAKYKNTSGLPHVVVAKRLIKGKERTLKQLLNHSIPYIICESDQASAADRAFHIAEVKANRNLMRPDVAYYANNQIINPIGRILAYLGDINMIRIGEAIGIKVKANLIQDPYADTSESYIVKKTLLRSRIPQNYQYLKWTCGNFIKDKDGKLKRCGHRNTFNMNSPFRCPHCGHIMSPIEVKNLFYRNLSQFFRKYYSSNVTTTGRQTGLSMVEAHELDDDEEEEEEEEMLEEEYDNIEVNSDLNFFIEIVERIENRVSRSQISEIYMDTIQGIKEILGANVVNRSGFQELNAVKGMDYKKANKEKDGRKRRKVPRMYRLRTKNHEQADYV